jgi:hypothetical protein
MFKNLPQIVRLAQRVGAAVENAVMRFPRYHKYSIGADLRTDGRLVIRSAVRAWRESQQRLERVREFAAAIDQLKDSMQLGKDVNAFGSFKEFEAVARLVNELGARCGGWLNSVARGQNGKASAPAQRAQILSSRVAHEAIP